MFFHHKSRAATLGLVLPALAILIVGCGNSDKMIFQAQNFEVNSDLLESSSPKGVHGITMSVPKGFVPAADSVRKVLNLSVQNQPEGPKYEVLQAFTDPNDGSRLLLISEIISVTGFLAKFPKFVGQYEVAWKKYAPDAQISTFSNGSVNLWQSKRPNDHKVHYRWLIDNKGDKAPIQVDLIYSPIENGEMDAAIESMIGSITIKEK